MYSIKDLEKKVRADLNQIKKIDARKVYYTPAEIEKFLIVKYVLKLNSTAKVIDALVNEKYNSIIFAETEKKRK